MKVILKENIKSIGKKDEIINVSDGYARNYLFAKNLAVEATNSNLAKLKSKKESEQYKKDVEKEEAEKQADKMSKIRLKFKVKAGENGKVFGGVSSKEIAEKLEKEYNIKVDKKKIELKEKVEDPLPTVWRNRLRGRSPLSLCDISLRCGKAPRQGRRLGGRI